ncbi:MAG TPA: ABC transporter permease [Rubricoccaceae bacterium]
MTGLLLLTLRELRARKVVVGLFVVSTIVWLTLALALQLDVVDGSLAGFRLFGVEETVTEPAPVVDKLTGEVVVDSTTGEPVMESDGPPFGSNPLESLVFGAEAFVAGAAYWVGILLCLFATGGLVASLVEPGQADLLVSKPLSRSAVLAGRLSGVALVALALLTYLLGAVWLVMSVKTGIWNAHFLLAIPAVFAMFAVLYGVVTLVSVWSGSGALALIVTLGLVFATLVLAIPNLFLAVHPTVRPLVEGLYYVLPRFASVGGRLVPHLATGTDIVAAVTAEESGAQPGPASLVANLTPLLSSVAFGAACYAGAFFLFNRRDY